MKKMIAVLLLVGTAAAASVGASGLLKITTAKKKEADVVLTSKNTVSLSGEVSDESVSALVRSLRDLDTDKERGEPIYLVLHTPGGSIQAGIELMEAVKGLRRPVNTVTIFAASMGFQIAQNLNDRLILSGGILMSHKARGGASGEFGPGGDSQLDKRLNLWKRRLLEMDAQTVARSNGKQTLQSYQAAYENELWLTGAESVAQGYADKVVSVRCDSSLSGTKTQSARFFGMEIKLTFSNCPLQTSPEAVEFKIPTNKGLMDLSEFYGKGGILGVDCSIAASRVSPTNGELVCSLNGEITREKIESERNRIVRFYTKQGFYDQVKTTP